MAQRKWNEKDLIEAVRTNFSISAVLFKLGISKVVGIFKLLVFILKNLA